MIKTIDRLIQFVEYIGLSARQFDLSIGAANGYTLRMKKNHASIGSDVIESILSKYPQLNVVWLLTGEGDMIKSDSHFKIPDFESITDIQKRAIESIVEKKLRERQDKELKEILQAVTEEIEKAKKKSSPS